MVRFRVASSALGEREVVFVHIYDDVEQLRAAAEAFNGYQEAAESDALGVTQCWTDGDERTVAVVVRLVRGHLGARVTSHEFHHAAAAIYGAHVGDRISRRAHLNHYNEPFAHLFSDLYAAAIDKLYALGFYEAAA